MSDQNPYEKLGVSEDASFDEIQDARNRLLDQHGGDGKGLELIESAYDAILMERLRMRQEGKIKVPERIRFPEMRSQSPQKENPTPREQSPAWLRRMLDQPSMPDVLLPGAWYLSLSAISLFYPAARDQVLQLALVVGVGVSIYFLNRKENKFGRAVLFTLGSLIIGLISGGLIATWILQQMPFINLTSNQFSTVLTFILMWIISSFLR
ncbi:CPP1-like family protein [Anabaena cylindrica FACHB-243]|uniref:Heat shock protein DnaJ domain protein n=1 Tax=Anabaena cylindrica (strain ATCC 27899 / PCC 7122) TaxID=272123 RepID=K9ZK48_ANACC|nr:MULTISPECIES: CPP1-like family protein [Anabaena]AFZ58922.1 heat shock protein DnaJ domain protein [Anabaena cylindrica PCC 7122]MBD2419505.1 CPP1-like family protein [Anabaena cylindrica FACHB-243]MBY5283968.1 molecular chaperone DnaJ [Anabaena sp. CCAP 1446/1C]MBY5310794.1 molecular chaperone DnaJ [Anabaena sp. CCAP 1446/1C]MCM2408312.1 CPP1-like family protein [Anabaena sp. CCAP 1446/1C]